MLQFHARRLNKKTRAFLVFLSVVGLMVGFGAMAFYGLHRWFCDVIVTDLNWSADGRYVFFEATDEHGRYTLFRLDTVYSSVAVVGSQRKLPWGPKTATHTPYVLVIGAGTDILEARDTTTFEVQWAASASLQWPYFWICPSSIVGTDSTGTNLYLYDLKTHISTALTEFARNAESSLQLDDATQTGDVLMTWSPNGLLGKHDLYLWSNRAKSVERLTRDGQSVGGSFDSDGRRLVFMRAGRAHLFDLSTKRVTPTGMWATLAPRAWSPDARWIAGFGKKGKDGWPLLRYDVRTGEVVCLLRGAGGSLSWSPKGESLAVAIVDPPGIAIVNPVTASVKRFRL